jgi:hypothetical protein
MEATTPQDADKPAPPRDLRAELFQNLSAQFTAALNSDASLPTVAREALVELLDSEALIAAEVIAAASKNDPGEEEAGDE